jgi:hypothetical protein
MYARCQCVCGAQTAVCTGCAQKYEHGVYTRCYQSPCQHTGKKLLCIGCGEDVAPDGSGILQAGLLIPWGRAEDRHAIARRLAA